MEKRLFTSECVTNGHPDKVADSISDAILDACLAQDPGSRVACETMVTTNFCLICGEITTKADVDYENLNMHRAVSEEIKAKLMEQFKKHTGIDMHIPAGFGRANSGDRSLLWFMRDYEKKAQYIFAFSQRYNGPEDFEGAALERMLINKLAVVHSDKPGSRLTISQNAPIYWSEIVANGRLWYELRGCWEVTFDQMGGPFVSFSTLDEERGIITTIVFALYAPEEGQRNPLRELEHLIYTIK